jgi:hypothetical protein
MCLCDVYNYADDNTICCAGDTVAQVTKQLEMVSSVMIEWFNQNMMKVNPEKFQYIVFQRHKNDGDFSVINVNDVFIKSQSVRH